MQQHSQALDGLRGLSAYAVFANHLTAGFFAAELGAALGALGWLARAAVIVFFVLSGFVVTRSLMGHLQRDGAAGAGAYALRRAARIYPPYLLALALCWIIGLAGAAGLIRLDQAIGSAPALDAGALLRSLAFLFRGADAVNALNGPLWSLRLEVILYAVTGLAGLAYMARGAARAAYALAAFALLALMSAVFGFAALAIASFGAGAMAAAAAARTEAWSAAARFSPWLSMGVFAAALPFSMSPEFAAAASGGWSLFLAWQALLAGCIALWVLALFGGKPAGGAWLSRFAWLGSHSYTLFVIHTPLLIALIAWLKSMPLWQPPGLRLVCFALAALAIPAITIRLAKFAEQPERHRLQAVAAWRFAAGVLKRRRG